MAGVVLAAGAGSRLAPLTDECPKALCPVGGTPLVDLAVERIRSVTAEMAVNLHHGREALAEHLGDRVHLSIERPRVLGTAGALGALRSWIDGRATVVVNADAWCDGGIERLVAQWSGDTIRLLVPGGGPFGPTSPVAGALMPWRDVEALSAEPSGLYEVSWAQAGVEGRIEVVAHDGAFVDCGTPAQYLEANLRASGGRSVIGRGATVKGTVERSVVWAGAQVEEGERLVDAVRTTGGATVLVRPSSAPARS
jgi:NDP-sugar pyrophosphorylase family protein